MKFNRKIMYYCFFLSIVQNMIFANNHDNGLPSIVESISNSIVPLFCNINDTFKIVGTGFYISGNGHILTASHVAKKPELYASFRNKLYKCQIIVERFTVNKDNPNKSKRLNWDVGLLKIKAKDTKPLILSSKKEFHIGEQIAIIGYFEGGTSKKVGKTTTIKSILTIGYISTVFPINAGGVYLGTRFVLDITAGPGSSGSPVIDIENGRVFGVLNSGKTRKFKLRHDSKPIKIPLGIADAEPVYMVLEYIEKYLSE